MVVAVKILKEAIGIPFKNRSFLVFSAIAIFPLCIVRLLMDFSTYPQTIEVASQFLFLNSQEKHNPVTLDTHVELGESIQKLLRNQVLFLVVIDVLSFVAFVSTVFAAAGLSKGEKSSLHELVNRLVTRVPIKGPLITHIYVNLISFSFIMVANSWGIAVSRMITWKIVLDLATYTLPVILWVYLQAVWGVAIVVSIVEGRHGIVALKRGWDLLRGKRFDGFLLMLISLSFFKYLWELSLEEAKVENRVPHRAAFVCLYSCLFWFGNLMMGVVSLVLYHHCRRNQLTEKLEGVVGEDEHILISTTTTV